MYIYRKKVICQPTAILYLCFLISLILYKQKCDRKEKLEKERENGNIKINNGTYQKTSFYMRSREVEQVRKVNGVKQTVI